MHMNVSRGQFKDFIASLQCNAMPKEEFIVDIVEMLQHCKCQQKCCSMEVGGHVSTTDRGNPAKPAVKHFNFMCN